MPLLFDRTRIGGVIAALLVPRTPDGAVDYPAFERSLKHILATEVSGVCLAGGTGEYAAASYEERGELLRATRRLVDGGRLLVAGLGAATCREALALAAQARQAGADVALAPAPHFYPYAGADVEHFFRVLAPQAGLPVLLYNLSPFTSAIPCDAVIRLIESVPEVVGIKDSSGELEILTALTARPELRARRIAGSDPAFRALLAARLCDGTISGTASVLPELTVAVFAAAAAGDQDALSRALQANDEAMEQLGRFPFPWALKAIAEARGLAGPPQFALPPSPERQRQLAALRTWFEGWWERTAPLLAAADRVR